MKSNDKDMTISFPVQEPSGKAWARPEIVDAPVASTAAKSPDQIESGLSIKLGS